MSFLGDRPGSGRPQQELPFGAPTSRRCVFALAGLSALAPFNLEVPPDGWNALYLRPLLIAGLAVGGWCALKGARARPALPINLAIGWLVMLWIAALLAEDKTLGSAGAVRITVVVVCFVAAYCYVRTEAARRVVIRATAGGVVVACCIGLVVWFNGADIAGTDYFFGRVTQLGPHPRLTRPWSHANVAGMSIGATGAAILAFGRPVRWILAVPVLAAVVLTYSRGAVVAFIAALIVMVALARRREVTLGAAAAAGFALLIALLAPGWSNRLDQPGEQAWYGVSIEAPIELELSPTGATTSVTVTNLSTVTWRAAGDDQVELTARWIGAGQQWVWAEHRWPLPFDFDPGTTHRFDLRLDPIVPVGTFDVFWDLRRDQDAYFLQFTGQEVSSRAIVFESPVGASEASGEFLQPRAINLSRGEIRDIAWTAFRENPWFGVGPANLRRSVADQLTPEQRFPGEHAHNIVLEPLATWGLLGTIPFVILGLGGLLRALVVVARERSLDRLIIAGTLVAVAVHGLVDWPLIFTSSAIPIGLFLGMAWAPVAREHSHVDPGLPSSTDTADRQEIGTS